MQSLPKFGQKEIKEDPERAQKAISKFKSYITTSVNRKAENAQEYEGGLIEVTTSNSSLFPHFGEKVENKQLLYPEEAFLLATKKKIVLFGLNIPQLLTFTTPLSEFTSYSVLKRKGIKVKRPKGDVYSILEKNRGNPRKITPEKPTFVCGSKSFFMKGLNDTIDLEKQLVCVSWATGFQLIKLQKLE